MSKIPSVNTAITTATSAIQSAEIQIPPLAGKADAISARLTNLKQRIEGFDGEIASAGDRFKENAFGSANVGSNKIGGFFDQVRSQGTGNSKNPLDGALLNNFAGGKLGHYSDDPAPATGTAPTESEDFSWSTFFGTVAEGLFGLFAPRGSPTGLLTGPGTVESVTGDPKDLINGVQAVAQSGDKDPRMQAVLDSMDKEPTPDDVGGGGAVITGADIKGIHARRGSKGEPTGEETSSSGAGGVATPKTAQQGEWINDAVSSVVVDSIALKGIEAKITANITIIR